jgi:tetratricopeptide (TPR) repeat protein
MKNLRLRSRLVRTSTPLTLALALASAAPALARDTPAPDRAQRARVAYDLRDWATAAREFRDAYDSEPKSEYLFGLAQALRQSRDFAGAIFTFKAYKRLDGVTPQQATAAELLITQCEAEQAKEEAAASLRQPQLAPPVPASSEAAPAQVERPLTTSPAPPPERTPEPSRPFYSDVLGDTLFIGSVAAAGVGTVLLLTGNSEMRKSSSSPTERSAEESADDAHGKQIVGTVLLPVSGVFLIGAVWRWMSVGSSADVLPEGVSLGPSSVSYRGQF